MPTIKEASSPKSAGGVPSLLISRELRWYYLVVFSLLLTLGIVLIVTGAYEFYRRFYGYEKETGSGLVYLAGGVICLLVALGVRAVREYFIGLQRATVQEIASVQLGRLEEKDFENFERVRQLQQRKAQVDFERNLHTPVAVQQFTARNVVLFPEVHWQLQRGINVILGRNGYGKSMILRALAGALQRDEEALTGLFSNTAANSSIEIDLQYDGEPRRVLRTATRFVESVGKVPLLAIPDSRLFDRSQATIGIVDSETADLRVYGAYHFLHQQTYGSVIQALLYEICLDYWEHGQDFDRPAFRFLSECVRRLTGFDFSFVSIERQGRTGFAIHVLTEGNPVPLPIQYASQGTLSVLAMFGLIRSYLEAIWGPAASGETLGHPGSGIVLIDEADAHLHPVWQQKVPALLREMFPSVQFILSAHSPLFVAGCWRGEVAVLRRAGPPGSSGGFRLDQVERDFVGATAAELYQQIFDIDEPDESYLRYSTMATQRTDHSKRINELERKRERRALSGDEETEYRALLDQSGRIRRAIEVGTERRETDDKDLRIAELESQVLSLRARPSPGEPTVT